MGRILILVLLLGLPVLGYAQTEITNGDVNSSDDNVQTGNLNNSNRDSTVSSNNTTDTKSTIQNYNGAGSSSEIPATSAISPTYMSNGIETCLMGSSSGFQSTFFGISGGSYKIDHECNRRRDAKMLSDLGMKVAAVSRMCGNKEVWKSMFLSGTPCPILARGKLIVGKRAYLMMKTTPSLHIPDYNPTNQEWYNTILGIGETNEEKESDKDGNPISISDRFRAISKQ